MEQTEILHMRVSSTIMRKLDGLRKREDDLPSRSEMVRRLIERGESAPPSPDKKDRR
jgi:metal-responsive CopG/Arc/MetJ family transcriptional regulator